MQTRDLHTPIPQFPAPADGQLSSFPPLTPPVPPSAIGCKRRPWAASMHTAAVGERVDTWGIGGGSLGGAPYTSHGRMHSAGAGHAAAMARRATAPSPPMMLMDQRIGTSESPANWGEHPRRGSPHPRLGMEPLTELEAENRALREELATYKSEAIGSLHRRPMAAIAGGGFRGPGGGVQKQCMCDSLRSKLAKIRAELREARCESRAQQGHHNHIHVCRDAEAQTTPGSVSDAISAAAEATRAAVLASSRSTSPPPRRGGRLMVDAEMQAEPKQTATVSSQANFRAPRRHAEVQAGMPPVHRSATGVQAGRSVAAPWLPPADSATQTAPPPRAADASAQAVACGAEMAVQASCQTPLTDTDTQTDVSSADAAAQVGAPASLAAAAASQTDAPHHSEASTQWEDPRRTSRKTRQMNSCAVACQTSITRTAVAVQTPKPARSAVGSQATPPPGVDQGTQAQDEEAKLREAKRDSQLRALEERVLALTSENSQLQEELDTMTEKAEAFQRMAQTRAFGQLNVTILCPRAECTVSGERVEMDSWNPARLREEFEREVLPRFTKVFVDEASGTTGQKTNRARSEAVDRAMQEFAETFRERLSAMLSAPNAAAAVQAAAAKGGRSSA
mmetsp:Transcript_103122/g.181731  ORF Transcript_103122/g.181731 Transcript_103122/m.181731 type:complete len:622 (+) Transcript_103122:240-2105(+)